jgi:TrbC/VIRB2 pilin
MKFTKTHAAALAAGVLAALFIAEPALAGTGADMAATSVGDKLADQVRAIVTPLLFVCAIVMGFGAFLKGDWKMLGGCLLMLLLVGSLIYGEDQWIKQIQDFSEGL